MLMLTLVPPQPFVPHSVANSAFLLLNLTTFQTLSPVSGSISFSVVKR